MTDGAPSPAHGLRDQPEYAALAEAIRAQAGARAIVHVPNFGNWGDALIAEGSRAFFRHFGIAVTEVAQQRLRKRAWLRTRLATRGWPPMVVFGGGGALAGQYPNHARMVARILRAAGRSVVLPSTFGADSVAALSVPGLIAFRRDEFQSRESFPTSRFCHDMAFFLAPDPVTPVRETGVFMRTDRERAGAAPSPPGNRDISAEGRQDTPVAGFFAAVGAARTIWTDRLHVAIAGALLGREVHLFPNSYFKNEAVFRTSLAPHFPNVRFHPRFDGLPDAPGGR
ncbi:MAG: hypothetical protein RQ752_10055 [Thermohalobaculum sp.]|nr:hypothetical protein [Thermohalobaculum sp.]